MSIGVSKNQRNHQTVHPNPGRPDRDIYHNIMATAGVSSTPRVEFPSPYKMTMFFAGEWETEWRTARRTRYMALTYNLELALPQSRQVLKGPETWTSP